MSEMSASARSHESTRHPECYDAVAPDGTRVAVDNLIGICLTHGWWFGLDGQRVFACPEPGCQADIQLYRRGERVRYLTGEQSVG